MKNKPRVGNLMGSESGYPVMREASEVLKVVEVAFEMDISSAHNPSGDWSTAGIRVPFTPPWLLMALKMVLIWPVLPPPSRIPVLAERFQQFREGVRKTLTSINGKSSGLFSVPLEG